MCTLVAREKLFSLLRTKQEKFWEVFGVLLSTWFPPSPPAALAHRVHSWQRPLAYISMFISCGDLCGDPSRRSGATWNCIFWYDFCWFSPPIFCIPMLSLDCMLGGGLAWYLLARHTNACQQCCSHVSGLHPSFTILHAALTWKTTWHNFAVFSPRLTTRSILIAMHAAAVGYCPHMYVWGGCMLNLSPSCFCVSPPSVTVNNNTFSPIFLHLPPIHTTSAQHAQLQKTHLAQTNNI